MTLALQDEQTGGRRKAAVGRALASVSTDTVGDYLRSLRGIAVLTAEQEVEIARRIEVGVFAEERLTQMPDLEPKLRRELQWLVRDGKRAYDQFIRSNLRLVVSIAKRYAGRGLPLMDVIQEGNLGLVRAVEKFDYKAGNKFSTYATWWIRQAILRGIADSARLIRIPVHTVEKMERLQRLQRDLTGLWGRVPTHEELAEEASMTVAEVIKFLGFESETVSLSTPVGEDEATEFGDLIEDGDTPDPSGVAEWRACSKDLSASIDELPVRDAKVVRLRFGLDGRDPMTLDEVGALYGITRERVRQLETRSLKRLQKPELREYLG